MMLSVLRRISPTVTRMYSVTVANILILKRVRFILELDITIQVRVDLFQEILMRVELKIR